MTTASLRSGLHSHTASKDGDHEGKEFSHTFKIISEEGIAAVRIDAGAGKSPKRRIRQRELVFRIRKTSLSVGPPDLQHCLTIAIGHPTFDADAFARNVWRDQVADEGVALRVLADRRQSKS